VIEPEIILCRDAQELSRKAAVLRETFSSPNCRLPAARVAPVDGQLT
jgi:hypothetical protein